MISIGVDVGFENLAICIITDKNVNFLLNKIEEDRIVIKNIKDFFNTCIDFKSIVDISQIFVGIEDVHCMPRDRRKSLSKMMFGKGLITGICSTCNFSVRWVSAHAWKKYYDLLSSQKLGKSFSKDDSIFKAKTYFPLHLLKDGGDEIIKNYGPPFEFNPPKFPKELDNHNNAEAFLIANYIHTQEYLNHSFKIII